MDKSSPTLSISPLIGSNIRDEKGANPGRTGELMIEPKVDHPMNIVFSFRDSPNFAKAAGRVPRDELKPKPRNTSAGPNNNDQKPGSGEPGKENTFVYTYSVGRLH